MSPCLKIALIPAYNPEKCLIQVVHQLREKGFWILVVDDGSTREHKEIFKEIDDAGSVLILTHTKNKGKGSALKTGLTYIQKYISENYIVVTLDADGQHRPKDVEIVYKAAKKHPGYLILGSRKIQKETPLKSRLGNQITRMVYALTTGIRIYDTQTGLRAFDNTILPELLAIPGKRYEYEMNVLLVCSRKKIPMKEIGIETIYINDNAGSHFNPLKDSYRIYKEILKFSASSLISFFLDYGIYSLLLWFTGGFSKNISLFLSNVMARILSGCFNYQVNRNLVFQEKTGSGRTAVQYVLLAAGILAGNTLLLEVLVHFGMNQYIGKLCTELIFFFISWFVQRTFIFRQQRSGC